jgi:hypothetical protein
MRGASVCHGHGLYGSDPEGVSPQPFALSSHRQSWYLFFLSELTPERPLTIREGKAIRRVLDAAVFEGAAELLAQIPHAEVVGGKTTWLDLRVPESVPRSTFREGHVPVRALVGADDPEGELLLWVKDGRLSALEYAWYTDEEPTEFPSPDVIHVQSES